MYLWSFLTYGFLGYLLEKVYALVTRSRHTVRKGYLLLPVCPVYGLAMLAVLALPPDMTDTFWHLALYGGLTATAVADAGGMAAADRRQLLHRPSAASISRHRSAGLEKPPAPPLRRLTSPFTNRLHGAAPFVLDDASIPW